MKVVAPNDPFVRLHQLVAEGQLRFVYVIGVARSNSTVVCRLLGERLDGAVYEPAMPTSINPRIRWARTILKAYVLARATVPVEEPVALAIKDLSLFVDRATFDFVRTHAEHIVFTIRDPLPQHVSLVRQFSHEFSPWQRLDASLRYPVEVAWMTWYSLLLVPRFVRRAAKVLGWSWLRWPQLAVAGWNIESWDAIRWQYEASRNGQIAPPITVFDAGLMRDRPDLAMAHLDVIAGAIAQRKSKRPINVAGHSRMLPRSRWAGEALVSHQIKPTVSNSQPPSAGPFESRLLSQLSPIYGGLFDSEHNRLRPSVTPKP